MTRISWIAGALVLVSFLISGFYFKPQVIYGDDNRQDVYSVQDANLKMAADSTVAFIARSRLTATDNSRFTIESKQYGADYGLCSDEAFFDQPIAANCSGFLVGEDLVATAGHCVSESECSDYSIVFGFAKKSPDDAVNSVSSSEVYNCKEVVAREMTDIVDYALIRLDRPVQGHKALKMAEHPPSSGDEVVVIGYPSGLPAKIAGGASVRTQMGDYFITNTDTYGGNSGSAVFDAKTLDVVGILVRGENDYSYDYQRACTASFKCGANDCRGEDVTNIWYIQKAMGK